jgi:hypothetical protein
MDIVLDLYKDIRTVFRLRDVAMLVGETDMQRLSKKLNYYVKTGQIYNPRRGIYTKSEYKPEELACVLYTPCYISLDYVLQKKGIIFQYSNQISIVSYLSRIIEIENRFYQFSKLKNEILINTAGVRQLPGFINMAEAERAFLDKLYLFPDFYFDNLNPINKELVEKLLPLYQSKALINRVRKLFQHV